ncbi:MAG: rod-binding protein [Bdellovibrionales bacterium]|nr:rod-binding protein [Bdellovibrionales bacterium]
MKIPSNNLSAPPQTKTPEEKLREVSEMYEKHFLGEMTKAMRSTIHEGGFIQSNQAEKIFREQLDQEYVDKWGQQGGIGLADLIYKQMVERYGVQMGIKNPVQKPQGPLPLTQKDEFTAKPFHQNKKSENLSFRFDKSPQAMAENKKPMEVSNPWQGVLLDKKTLLTGENLLEVEHDNGLKSQLVFKGSVNSLKPGQKIQAGETVGLLSPEAKTFFWHTQTGPQDQAAVSE